MKKRKLKCIRIFLMFKRFKKLFFFFSTKKTRRKLEKKKRRRKRKKDNKFEKPKKKKEEEKEGRREKKEKNPFLVLVFKFRFVLSLGLDWCLNFHFSLVDKGFGLENFYLGLEIWIWVWFFEIRVLLWIRVGPPSYLGFWDSFATYFPALALDIFSSSS